MMVLGQRQRCMSKLAAFLVVDHERACLKSTKPAQEYDHSCCHYFMTLTFVINITNLRLVTLSLFQAGT